MDDAYLALFGNPTPDQDEENDIFKALEAIPKVSSAEKTDNFMSMLGTHWGIESGLFTGGIDNVNAPAPSSEGNGTLELEPLGDVDLPDVPDALKDLRGSVEDDDIVLPEILVSNVVCGGNVNCQLNLQHCNTNLKNSSMDRSSFPALFVRLKNVTLLLFSTGKVLATGGKTFEDSHTAISRLVVTLKKLKYGASMGPVTVENIVSKVVMGFPISLSDLAAHPLHKRYCVVQGKNFHCVNYWIEVIQPRITVRIFSNGVILFQSAKSLQSLRRAVQLMVPVFYQFKRPHREPVDPATLMKHF